MAKFEIIIPKMGESIIEATITKWLKKEGDTIIEEDPIVELATDKVDSEIPSPVDGKIIKILFNEGDVVPVGEVIAIIQLEGSEEEEEAEAPQQEETAALEQTSQETPTKKEQPQPAPQDDRFYSPLVKRMAEAENITPQQLAEIEGSGRNGRVTKEDMQDYIQKRETVATPEEVIPTKRSTPAPTIPQTPAPSLNQGDEVVEMDRMRKLIADHMVASVHTSPHVTSFIEVDMEPIVQWRKQHKAAFEKREKQKLTYTPFFLEATAKALKDFPGVNASVDNNHIILRSRVNIGMAAALPNGNLIVPVIKDADKLNLSGLASAVNDLANRSRENQLKPDEIAEGTFTITNLGTFGSITGTPIINQPQVAILGIGVIKKKPVVVESAYGDTLAIRHQCVLSLSYDHRVVDGALGGMFLQRIAQYLENFAVEKGA
ncbi:MAG: diapophytoene dehydrogenase [Bacteroidetes bacterium]|nr:MAG: diapophytoene dehydrogenase [Bacteroidota bacterium]